MKNYSLGALVAAGVLAGALSTSASAADLGGNCCADLEERIAELEATTARKGNRKVSLTISGFVAKQLLFSDDGKESNVYITDTGSISIGTHVKFTGQATIAPGWTAGYVLKIEAITDDSLLVNQNTNSSVGDAFGTGSLGVESSYWFVKSDQLGRLSLGRQSSAADNQAILPDGSGSLVVANYVLYDSNAFLLRNNAGALSGINYGSLAACSTFQNGGGNSPVGASADCDGGPNSNIRYDTPVFAGFSASASWGEDDIWTVSGRYSGEMHDFKFATAIAYVDSTDETGASAGNVQARANGGFSAQAFQVGAYVEHVPTGLFVYGAYGKDYSDISASARGAGRINPEGDNWYIKAGLRTRVNALGHTIFYGEYGENNDKFTSALFDAGVNSTQLQNYGIGVVQEVDAAAMSFWLAWRHLDADDITCVDQAVGSCGTAGLAAGNNSFDSLDLVKAGALINF